MRELTVIQFAKKVKKNRITIYGWIRNKSLPTGTRSKVVHGHLIIEVDEDFRNE